MLSTYQTRPLASGDLISKKSAKMHITFKYLFIKKKLLNIYPDIPEGNKDYSENKVITTNNKVKRCHYTIIITQLQLSVFSAHACIWRSHHILYINTKLR